MIPHIPGLEKFLLDIKSVANYPVASIPSTTGSDFVVPSKDLEYKLLFTLAFPNTKQAIKDYLLPLIITFRTTPFINLFNLELAKMIGDIAGRELEADYSPLVPVGLEELKLEATPNQTQLIQVTLTAIPFDASCCGPRGVLQFVDADPTRGASGYPHANSLITKALGISIKKFESVLDDLDFDYLKWTSSDPFLEVPDLLKERVRLTNCIGRAGVIRNNISIKPISGSRLPFLQYVGFSGCMLRLNVKVPDSGKADEATLKAIKYLMASIEVLKRKRDPLDSLQALELADPIGNLLTLKPKSKYICHRIAAGTDQGTTSPISYDLSFLETNEDLFKLNAFINVVKGIKEADFKLEVEKRILAGESARPQTGVIPSGTEAERATAYELVYPSSWLEAAEPKDAPYMASSGCILNADVLLAMLVNDTAIKETILRDPWLSRSSNTKPIGLDETALLDVGLNSIPLGATMFIPAGWLVRLAVAGAVSLASGASGLSRTVGVNFYELIELLRPQVARLFISTHDTGIDSIATALASILIGKDSAKRWLTRLVAHPTTRLSAEGTAAIAKTLVERKLPSTKIRATYAIEGLIAAFDLVTMLMSLGIEQPESLESDDLFPSLALPSYVELFGESWTNFVPKPELFGQPDLVKLIVRPNDKVPPYIFYDWKTYFNQVVEHQNSYSRMLEEQVREIPIDLNLTPEQLAQIPGTLNLETLLKLLEERPADSISKQRALSALEEILREVAETQTNRSDKIDTLFERLEQKIKAGELKLKFRFRYEGKRTSQPIPLSAAVSGPSLRQLYQDLDGILNASTIEEFLQSYSEGEAPCHLGMKKALDQSYAQAKAQLKEAYRSPIKLFPVVRFYIVQPAGHPLTREDHLLGYPFVTSIDVTLDKDEAGLAVIKMVDPMGLLEYSDLIFSRSKFVKLDGISTKVVFSLSPEQILKEFYKESFLEHGQRVIIRAGYGNHYGLLETIFSGRISEVGMGDQITLVAQDWKAGLFSSELQFYTERDADLNITSHVARLIQKASPDGFGEVLPEHQLRQLGVWNPALLSSASVMQAFDVASVTNTYTGYKSFLAELGLYDWGTRYAKGLDTRLKNIWAPYRKVNNRLYINRYYPDHQVDQWLIQQQPLWTALQEAARHTFNYVVDTRPFGTESTIYFGRPDGHYYFRNSRTKSKALLTAEQEAKTLHKKIQGKFNPNSQELRLIKRAATPGALQKNINIKGLITELGGPEALGLLFAAIIKIPADILTLADYSALGTTINGIFTTNDPVLRQDLGYRLIGQLDYFEGRINSRQDSITAAMEPLHQAGLNILGGFVDESPEGYKKRSALKQLKSAKQLLQEELSAFQKARERFLNKDSLEDDLTLLILSIYGVAEPPALEGPEPTIGVEVRSLIAKTPTGVLEEHFNSVRPFRNHWWASNRDNLVANQISASDAEMANTILIRYPKDNVTRNMNHFLGLRISGAAQEDNISLDPNEAWAYYPEAKPVTQNMPGLCWHPKALMATRLLKTVHEINVRTTDVAGKLAITNLVREMRPMYRGDLVLLGQYINPWDLIYLSDSDLKMHGHIEVSRVIHHYNPRDGWVSVVKPHLVTMANPEAGILKLSRVQQVIDSVVGDVEKATNALTLIALLAPPVAAFGGSAGVAGVLQGVSKIVGRGTLATGRAIRAAFTTKGISTLSKEVFTKATAKAALDTLKSLGIATATRSIPAGLKWFLRGQGIRFLTYFGSDTLIVPFFGNEITGSLPMFYAPLIIEDRPYTAGVSSELRLYTSLTADGVFYARQTIDGVTDWISNLFSEQVRTNYTPVPVLNLTDEE